MPTTEEILEPVLSAKAAVRQFEDDNHELMDAHRQLLKDFNTAAIQAKNELRKLEFAENRANLGNGVYVQKKREKGYDPKVLAEKAPDLLAVPGVVVRVDKIKVSAVAQSDADWQEAAMAAWYDEPTTPAIGGLRTIDMDL